jgi:hypothetical protein
MKDAGLQAILRPSGGFWFNMVGCGTRQPMAGETNEYFTD